MYSTTTDVANIACELLGVRAIGALSDSSLQATELSRVFDKMRQSELRAHAWRFAVRPVALRIMLGPNAVAQGVTFPAYVGATTYNQGDVVSDTTANAGNSGTALYVSLVGSNSGNTPSSSPLSWAPWTGPDTYSNYDSGTTYLPGEIVYDSAGASNDKLYLCTGLSLGTAPHSSANFVGSLTSATRTTTTLFEPVPHGYFNTLAAQKSLYRLPVTCMRLANQDPKVTGTSFSTVGAGQQYNDWQLAGRYLQTATTTTTVGAKGPLLVRACFDIPDVTQWEPLFATATGHRLAFMVRERVNPAKDAKTLLDGYTQMLALAIRDDLIEQGSTDPEDDQFLTAALNGYGLMPGGGGAPQRG